MADVSKIIVDNTTYDIKDPVSRRQVSVMPTYTDYALGDIVQYIGTTDANYTNGYFYKRGASGWENIPVQSGGGASGVIPVNPSSTTGLNIWIET